MDKLHTVEEGTIRTLSGIYMDVFNPTPDMFRIEDIAHALSHQCRFGGHLKQFYSVCQHSYFCSKMAPESLKLQALLHDLTEAYICDLPSPIKRRLKDYQEIEDKMMRVAAEKFGFEYPLNPIVKEIDQYALEVEWNILVLGNYPQEAFAVFTPQEAREKLLDLYYSLTSAGKFTEAM